MYLWLTLSFLFQSLVRNKLTDPLFNYKPTSYVLSLLNPLFYYSKNKRYLKHKLYWYPTSILLYVFRHLKHLTRVLFIDPTLYLFSWLVPLHPNDSYKFMCHLKNLVLYSTVFTCVNTTHVTLRLSPSLCFSPLLKNIRYPLLLSNNYEFSNIQKGTKDDFNSQLKTTTKYITLPSFELSSVISILVNLILQNPSYVS